MDVHRLIRSALRHNKAIHEHLAHWQYFRVPDGFRTVPRGTAVFAGKVIWGYPEIGRILRLDRGLPEHFTAPVWVEEKVDGYNVRVFKQGEELLALTRRGYICPFTTDRLPDLINPRIFEEQPDIVLCAEVAGPENPYNEGYPPYITEDVRLLVFDMMRQNAARFLPHQERLQLLEEYGLPGVTQYGQYQIHDLEALKALLLTINEENREGVVFKEDSERDKRIKYITSATSLNDIRVTATNILQLPPEFYMHRILWMALFMDEAGIEGSQALYADLGESLLEGVFQAIRQYQQHRKVFHTYCCRFRHKSNAQLFIHSLKKLLGHSYVYQRRLKREGDFYVLEFDKILPKETGLLSHHLGGGLTFD